MAPDRRWTMRSPVKIVVVLIVAILGICALLAIYIVVAVNRQIAANTLNKQLQLSDGALLRVKGTPTEGPDSGRTWEISYRANSGWQEVGSWWGNSDGNVLACPAGSITVITRTGGPHVFVQLPSGAWKMFLMEIPGAYYFGHDGEIAPNFTSLDKAEILSIRRSLSVDPKAQGGIDPLLMQFVPRDKGLLADYLTAEHRRFRLHFALDKDAEKFHLVNVEEKPFDQNRPYFEQFIPDIPLDPACSHVAF
jgi:hypothetical protein